MNGNAPPTLSPASRGAPVFLSGLPRSGSTLLTNILAMHPHIAATPTSPLYPMLEAIRHAWSEEETLLAQLDADFPAVYDRMQRSLRAFMGEWSFHEDAHLTIDKHRGWLMAVATLKVLYPEFRLIICLRDLRDVYSSLERRHAETLLLTYPGRLEQNLVEARAQQLFAPAGLLGGPLRSLYNLADVPGVMEHLYFWRYESFRQDPAAEIARLQEWLGVEAIQPDLQDIRQSTQESDSHYRFKFPHQVSTELRQARGFRESDASPRILASIVARFGWYYRWFYREDGEVNITSDGGPWDAETASETF